MRIGILALLHESNTFISQPTTLDHFRSDLFLHGEAIPAHFSSSHHEIGGFLSALTAESLKQPLDIVPLVAFRATPGGPITEDAFRYLVSSITASIASQPPLDGLLIAAHGAAVAESFADADGYWLEKVRHQLGSEIPIIATLDAHANLSPKMVRACDALIAYRTNPHLDQRERGVEAARFIVATLRGDVRPTMAAAFPPLVINIERQGTEEPHLKPLYQAADAQRQHPKLLSNSILLGFPYADVLEMGAAAIAVTNDDPVLAQRMATELEDRLWNMREHLIGQLCEVDTALDLCTQLGPTERICLLDMGDNVGGGSAGDGTVLANAILKRRIGPSFVCLYDPHAVAACRAASIGETVTIDVGGKTDHLHGFPLAITARIVSRSDGRFHETEPRHGGITDFDQGATVILQSMDAPLTWMLTSKRMVPFSLQQLVSTGLDPRDYRILVAKGVHAPLAAYREVCSRFLRVNTPGSTCADLRQLPYTHRRQPLFPFE